MTQEGRRRTLGEPVIERVGRNQEENHNERGGPLEDSIEILEHPHFVSLFAVVELGDCT